LRIAFPSPDDAYRAPQASRRGFSIFQDLLVKAPPTLLRDPRRRCADNAGGARPTGMCWLDRTGRTTDPVARWKLVETAVRGRELRHGALFAVGDHKQSI